MEMVWKRIALLTVFLAIAASLLAAEDPFIGTWALNKEKSKFDPGPMPQNITHTYQAWEKDGMKIKTVTVGTNGKESVREYTEKFDGKEYVEPNDAGRDHVSIKRVNAYRQEGVGTLKGVVTGRFSRQISPDGKTMTIETVGLTPDGRQKHDIRVFDKQ
jgi:hypothetical protein